MTMSIIDQQMELYFANDFGRVSDAVDKWIGRTIIMMQRWGKGSTWVSLEGGRDNVRLSALGYVIEADDLDVGLKAYGKYINREYGNRDRLISLDDERGRDDDRPLGVTLEAVSPFGASPSGGLQALSHLNQEHFLKDEEEYELFSLLGDLGPNGRNKGPSHTEAADLLGWDMKRVKRVYARVHARRRYSEDTDVQSRRKANAARYRA